MDLNAVLAHPFWGALIRIIIALGFLLSIVPFLIWWERRLLSWMQDRIGPSRVGPFGLLQTICDGVKLFFKEEIQPRGVDRFVWMIAPGIALFPAMTAYATIPWGPNLQLTPVANVNIGVLYVLAISSLGVYGIVLGGWASNNKYSLLGGLRSSAQLISYELAMGFSLGTVIIAAGSLELPKIVASQLEPFWGSVPWLHNWFILTPWGFIGGMIFLVSMVAETNRTPFDLPEAESELIAGFHTEYSSMKFAVFFMGEYAMMLVFSALFTVLFLGGWSPLPVNLTYLADHTSVAWLAGLLRFLESSWIAGFWFIGKLVGGISFYIWLRATLPRLRYDQLMALGWKGLMPLAILNLAAVSIWIAFGIVPGLIAAVAITVLFLLVTMGGLKKFEARSVTLLDEAVPLR